MEALLAKKRLDCPTLSRPHLLLLLLPVDASDPSTCLPTRATTNLLTSMLRTTLILQAPEWILAWLEVN